MNQFFISGIQQIGVGTVDFLKTQKWIADMFGADVKILEDDTVAERMLRYTGGVPQKRHAGINVNLQGGGGFEIWQYSERKPCSCNFEVKYGDLGIFAAKVRCLDAEAFHKELKNKLPEDQISERSVLPDGTECFYVRDLYGNLYQIVENNYLFINDRKKCGGIYGAMIGVSDMDKSLKFYNEVLGYDKIVYDRSGSFKDLALVGGKDGLYRRVLVRRSRKVRGAFSGLYGDNTLELMQCLDREPKKIYEGRYWGDPGFIQICYDVKGMRELGEHCASKGSPFTIDSCPDEGIFDMGEASGHFTYIEDPDGTLIEFVEIHKIPIIAKFGWFIDMKKRDREKPLSKWLYKIMGIMSRIPKKQMAV